MAEQFNELGSIYGLMQQGFTPEQARARVDEARAMQFAQLSPSQQRTMLGMQTASGIGRSLGSLFGVQQEDPLMRSATQLRATLSEQDMETSEGVLKAYRAVKDINPGVAEGLLKRYGELRKQEVDIEAKKAEIAKDKAAAERERVTSTPAEIQRAQRIAALKAAIPAYEQAGDKQTAELLKNELNALQKEEKALSFGTDRESVAAELYNKPFSQLTQAQKAVVNKRVQDEKRDTTARINVAPELKLAPNIVDAVAAADKATEREVNMLDSARLAKQLINQTVNSNNSQTWEAARTTIAKAVGENKLSNEDIRRTGVDPRLVQGALDWVNKKIEGVPSQDIQRQLFVLGSVLEKNAAERYDAKIGRFRSAAEASKFPGRPSTYFPTAEERNQTQPNVVNWSDLGKKK